MSAGRRRAFPDPLPLASSPQSRLDEAADEAALEDEEADEEWEGGEKRAGHYQLPRRAALAALRERGQANGQRPAGRRVRHDKRPEKIVPVVADRDDGEGHDRRPPERDVDVPEHLPPVRAVDVGRVLELAR